MSDDRTYVSEHRGRGIRVASHERRQKSLRRRLEFAGRTVTKSILGDCQAAGLASLPDELLIYIFEMYNEMCISPDGYVDNDMLKIESIPLIFDVETAFDEAPVRPLSLPCLISLDLKIRYRTPELVISQVMALVPTQSLIILKLGFRGTS